MRERGGPRPLLPLVAVLAVLLLDVAAVVHWYEGPGMLVSRAAMRTAGRGACREVILARLGATDEEYVIDARTGRLGPSVVIGHAIYRGGTLTSGSAAAIAAGRDLDLAAANPAKRQPSLAAGYAADVGGRDSWIGGPCMPFEDPLTAGLHPSGMVALGGRAVRIYAGSERYARGAFRLYARATVHIGVTAGGTLAFEQLSDAGPGGPGSGRTSGGGLGRVAPQSMFVRFLPAGAPLRRLAPAARRTLYAREYRAVLRDWERFAPESAPLVRQQS